MSINIQPEVKENYLYVHCQGVFTKDALLEAADKALEMMAQKNLAKLLFDGSDLEGDPPTTMQRYAIGNEFQEKQRSMGRFIKCAVVGKEPLVESQRFGQTVAVNRGALLKVFTEITDAVEWLKE